MEGVEGIPFESEYGHMTKLVPKGYWYQHLLSLKSKFKPMYLDDDRENSSSLKTKVGAYNSLPEVEQFSKIMQDIYKDFCLEKLGCMLSMVDPFLLPEVNSKDKY